MQVRTLLITVGLGTVVSAALAWALWPNAPVVEVVRPTLGPFEQTIDEEGRTRLSARYRVTAPVTGSMARMPWREGDTVTAGTVITPIEPLPAGLYDARTRRELGARLEAAQANLERTRSRWARAQIGVRLAEQNLRRRASLADRGYLSASQREADELALASAVQDQTTAWQEQRQAESELQQARAALASTTALRHDPAAPSVAVKAPISGQVLKVWQVDAGVVNQGAPLLELGDTHHLEVVTELLTTDALRTQPGDAVRIEGWGQELPLHGRVRAIEPAAFTKVSALGVEEQRVKVVIDLDPLPPSARALGDGFRVAVRIIILRRPEVVRVPAGAVFPMPRPRPADPAASTWAVLVVEAGRARLRPIQLGARAAGQAWISHGLTPRDTVIVYPPTTLRDGQRVRLRASWPNATP